MPADPPDSHGATSATTLLLQAGGATAADSRRRAAAVRDVLMEEEALDERLRAAVRLRIAAAVAPIERDLRLGAARRLAEMQAGEAAERLLDDTTPTVGQLAAMARPARDALVGELLDLARLDALAAALPVEASEGGHPSLLVRLADCPEPDVAMAASGLLAVLAPRGADPASVSSALPDTLHAPVAWWCAAVLRDRLGDERRADHALVEAVEDLLADHPGDPRPEDAAMRLAEMIRARAGELPGLLVEALGDRRPELFAAVLAQASGLDYRVVRGILLDPDGDRLWLLLRAQDVDRATIARIGVALADADPRRDLDRLADMLDAAAATTPEAAAAFFADAVLPPAYREARRALTTMR